jgi:zinc and cadmium transporter
MTLTLAIFSAAIIAASLLGGCLPLAAALTHTRLQTYLSFAAGTMLGAAFFHMLPEAVSAGTHRTLWWSAAGLLALFFLERYFAFHHHEAPAVPEEPCPPHAHEHAHGPGHAAGLVNPAAPGQAGPGTKGTALNWSAAAVGLAAHTIAGGVALASAAAAGARGGPGVAAWGVFVATLVHKPADALTIVSLMLRAGVPRATAHLVNLGFSLMIPLGVGLFFLGVRWAGPSTSLHLTANVLAFSAGTFLCIALSDLLPELQFHAHDRLILSGALLCGIAIMALAGLWE